MATAHLLTISLAVSVSVACAQPTSPSDPHLVTPPNAPWALSGQSNAVYVQPYLTAVAPSVITVAQGSQPIRAWNVGEPLWTQLVADLHQPLAAFVWWQGESDEDDLTAYPIALDDLLARVRVANGNPNLLIVLCGANDYPANADLIRLQQLYAQTRARVRYVPSNDLPDLNGSQHLTDDGYRVMADRIAAVIRQDE